ncbi:MAG TPA: hypothetical protein ENN84_08340, partial [Candidatus Marinimicrobia bacterium]|nr:hypothetical protein [Candidatus Neomarinimicrobiota bacterium]
MNRYIINHRLHDDFNKTQFHMDPDCCDCHAIGPIAPLNVLVGANNSGKSRFMRSLIKSSSIILGSNRKPTTIEQLQSIRQSLIEAKKEQGHLKLVISTRIIDDISQVGKSITDKLAIHLAKRKNIDYLAELPENIRRLIDLYEGCDNKERFESFKQALLSIQMDLRMLLAAFRKRDCNRYGPKNRFDERLGHIGYTFDSHLIEDEHIDTIKCLSKKLVKLQNLSLPPLCKTYIPALR